MTDVDAFVRVADEEIRATTDTAAGTAVVAAANRAVLDEVAAWRAECRRRVGQAVYPDWRSKPRRDDGTVRAGRVLAERRRREAARQVEPEPGTRVVGVDMAALFAAPPPAVARSVAVADHSSAAARVSAASQHVPKQPKRSGGMMTEIDIYPVGLLADLRNFWYSPQGLRRRLRRLAHDLRTGIIDRARARRWRALKTYFDGYHAEHTTLGSRCGTGWTRVRAHDDLMRHLAATGQADG